MLRVCLPFELVLSALLLLLTPALAAPREITGVARVIDGDTLDVGETRVRLFGIDAVERHQTCRHPTRGDWPCGQEVAQEVALWLDGEPLSCQPEDRDRFGRMVATCYLREADVGAVLVEAGLAFAYAKYSSRYETLQARALAAGRGLWTSVVVPPERFRRGSDPVVPAQAGCRIKGNIAADGTRIYHLPGQAWYSRTRISPEKGERWFCSEAEARRAGWRRARR